MAIPVCDDDEKVRQSRFITPSGIKRNFGPTKHGHSGRGTEQPNTLHSRRVRDRRVGLRGRRVPCCVSFGVRGFNHVAQYVRKRFDPKRLIIVADGDPDSEKSADYAASNTGASRWPTKDATSTTCSGNRGDEISRRTVLRGAREARSAANLNAAETLNDLGNKDRFVHANRERLSYIPEPKSWSAWDGSRWRINNREPSNQAERVVRQIFTDSQEAEGDDRLSLLKFKVSASLGKLKAMVTFAESSVLAVPKQRWDADPVLLGVANGIVNLRTGEVLPPGPLEAHQSVR